LLDWTDIKGADDLVAKSKDEWQEIESIAVKEVIGNPKDPQSNAGLIRELTELMVEDPGYYTRPLTFIKMLEDKTSSLDPVIPREREVRKRAMEINEEAFNFLHEFFGGTDSEAIQEVSREEGYTYITTTTPTKNGFHFSKTKIYLPGHDPKADPVPDNFYAEVSSISEEDKQDPYKNGSYRRSEYLRRFGPHGAS